MVPSETDEAKYKDVFFGAEKAAENCKSVVAMCLAYHALINRIPTQKTKEEKVRVIKEPPRDKRCGQVTEIASRRTEIAWRTEIASRRTEIVSRRTEIASRNFLQGAQEETARPQDQVPGRRDEPPRDKRCGQVTEIASWRTEIASWRTEIIWQGHDS